MGASLAVLDLLEGSTELRDRLMENAQRFREGMTAAGFELKPGFHPIVPIMLGDARLAAGLARDLLDEGIYVIGFSFPVVPKGEARIRVQLSAAHTPGDGRPGGGRLREGGAPARRDRGVTVPRRRTGARRSRPSSWARAASSSSTRSR